MASVSAARSPRSPISARRARTTRSHASRTSGTSDSTAGLRLARVRQPVDESDHGGARDGDLAMLAPQARVARTASRARKDEDGASPCTSRVRTSSTEAREQRAPGEPRASCVLPTSEPIEERVQRVDVGDERLGVRRVALSKAPQDLAIRAAVADLERLLRGDEVGLSDLRAVDEVLDEKSSRCGSSGLRSVET
jgi:hypothetical protein